jgi:glycosyltransferase involved in cell wall biosynthesis
VKPLQRHVFIILVPMMPKVSFLVPFLNPGDALFRCIDSMLSQEGPLFEIVLVDNGSTDGTYEQVSERYRIHHLIRLAHEPQPGIAHALNTGLKYCSGTYIARMDADDVCLPGRIALQSQLLDDEPEIGLVSGLVQHQGPTTNEGMAYYVETINSITEQDAIRKHRFVESPLAHPSVMFRKSLIDQFGNYSTNAVPEDYELWLRWMDAGVKMKKVNQQVIVWNDSPERLSRTHANYSREAFEEVRVHYLTRWLRAHVRPDKPVFIWGGGKYSKRKCELLESNGIRIHGFIDVVEKAGPTNKPTIHYTKIPPAGTMFILSSVSNRGKHEEIRSHLLALGYSEEVDFIVSS